MNVTVDKTFPVAAAPLDAWRIMSDIAAVTPCLPGAEILEQTGPTQYVGRMKVKLGPVSAAFKGTIDVVSLDATKRELVLQAKGADAGGTSHAAMTLVASLSDAPGGTCLLTGHSEFTIGGKIANLGSRMVSQVSDQLLKTFAANFESRASGKTDANAPATSLDGIALGLGVLKASLGSLGKHEPK